MSKPISIKQAQKESQMFRVISDLFSQTSMDDSRLRDVFINKVALSPDKSVCNIYFYSFEGEEKFKEVLDVLILYKGSLRKALAHTLDSRYTPHLVFKFDHHFKKQEKIENLIDKVKQDLDKLDN